jgi:chemotaxis-related protein WspD
VTPCWNVVGVRGDRSCEQLAEHVHCRNCPVYSSAARELLDRSSAAGDVAAATRHFAKAKADDQEIRQSLMIFLADGEWLALSAATVIEVAEMRPIHSLPHRRGGVVLGLTNVRGELLTCASLSRLLQSASAHAASQAATRKRLLVLRFGDLRVACPADDVHGLERVTARELSEVPATVSSASVRHTRAVLSWQGRTVGVIDELLLSSALRRSLS